MDPRIADVVELLERQRAAGLHRGVVMYASLRGAVIADLAVGELTSDAVLPWLSAGKPIAAVAIAQLWEKGLLELDDAVARHVPEFAGRGKSGITLRHLLTHTAGIRLARLEKGLSWEETIERICDAPVEPDWVVGETAGYHALTSWFVLGEIVRRLSGKAWEAYAREQIFGPVGMTHSSFAQEASFSPGAGARGPARELAMFYEMLLRRGLNAAGRRVLLSQSVEALTARHRVGMLDDTFKHIIDWGLGFIINSNQYGVETVPYGYGRHASPRAFGHGGRQCCTGFADPVHGLAAALIFSGAPGEEAHQARMRDVLSSLYEGLGLRGQQHD
jgi:CubicO group peptidase (beta-lactamase class C family)